MERTVFLLFILHSLLVASPMSAAAESQTWTIRAGDNLDSIAAALEIPNEEIKKYNPEIVETNLQIGQKLKLPLRSYLESKTIEDEMGKKDAQIAMLERNRSDLEKRIAIADSELTWHPLWFWGFWIYFAILAFIACGAYWIFRQTHPRVFEEPHDRTISDLRESQIRARSTFPSEDEGPSSRGGLWQPSLKRLSTHH